MWDLNYSWDIICDTIYTPLTYISQVLHKPSTLIFLPLLRILVLVLFCKNSPALLQKPSCLWVGQLSPAEWNNRNSTSASISASDHFSLGFCVASSTSDGWSNGNLLCRGATCTVELCALSRKGVLLAFLWGVCSVGEVLHRFFVTISGVRVLAQSSTSISWAHLMSTWCLLSIDAIYSLGVVGLNGVDEP